MASNLSFSTLFFIIAGGILPAIFWLWFWLREDSKKPEPHGLILLTFLTGGIVVLFAAFFQCLITDIYVNGFATLRPDRIVNFQCLQVDVLRSSKMLLILWVAVEEFLKLFAAWIATRHRRALDEPIDYMIYLITAALGFAAFENTLYLLAEVGNSGIPGGLASISIRFAGATLLHVLASSIIGGIYALSFCSNKVIKSIHIVVGFVIATLLHAGYNFFIIVSAINGTSILPVLIALWVGIVFLLIFFERVKHIVCVVPLRKKKR